jgi:hypothetical protein
MERLLVLFQSPSKQQITFHEARKFTSARDGAEADAVDYQPFAIGIHIAQDQ